MDSHYFATEYATGIVTHNTPKLNDSIAAKLFVGWNYFLLIKKKFIWSVLILQGLSQLGKPFFAW